MLLTCKNAKLWIYALLLAVCSHQACATKPAECAMLKTARVDDDSVYMDLRSSPLLMRINALTLKIESHLGIPVQVQAPQPWARALFKLKTGEIDLIASVYGTNERKSQLLLTEPYTEENLHIFINKNSNAYPKAIWQLGSYRGAGIRKTSYGEKVDQQIKKASASIMLTASDSKS